MFCLARDGLTISRRRRLGLIWADKNWEGVCYWRASGHSVLLLACSWGVLAIAGIAWVSMVIGAARAGVYLAVRRKCVACKTL